MTLPIAFNDTPPGRPVPVKDLERQRIIRQALIAFELGEAQGLDTVKMQETRKDTV